MEYTSPLTGFKFTTLVMIGTDCTGDVVYTVKPFWVEVQQTDDLILEIWQGCGFFQVLRFPPPIKLTAMISPKYCESGVKHHNHHKLN